MSANNLLTMHSFCMWRAKKILLLTGKRIKPNMYWNCMC